jgi:hypothetical protein
MTTPEALARTAGVLYLLLAGAAFNEGYVLPRGSRPWGGALLTAFDVARGKGLYQASARVNNAVWDWQ